MSNCDKAPYISGDKTINSVKGNIDTSTSSVSGNDKSKFLRICLSLPDIYSQLPHIWGETQKMFHVSVTFLLLSICCDFDSSSNNLPGLFKS